MSRVVRAQLGAGRALLDLTLSNPTRADIHYPASLLGPLHSADAITYDPSPFGIRRAREAVAADYSRRGIRVDPSQIVLTSSTSEAYSLLFKLL